MKMLKSAVCVSVSVITNEVPLILVVECDNLIQTC